MRVIVDFQGESLEFEVPSDRVVAAWAGPAGMVAEDVIPAVRDALERPREFPPLAQMIVPGDRVTVAFDAGIPQPREVLDGLVEVLGRAGVVPENLTVVAPAPPMTGSGEPGAPLDRVEVHDPDDRARIAYLASTKEGRRVYLNRSLTDADVVVPVGLMRYDPEVGYRGPWSVLFPGLSDRETLHSLRDHPGSGSPEAERRHHERRLEESAEVSWLLGTQFYLGIVPAARGLLEVVAGRDAAVRERGIASLSEKWRMQAPSRADVVVAGVGGPGAGATLEDLALALETAGALVQQGGKIVVLSRAAGPIGPALQRLTTADDPREALAALRGHEHDEDYPIARRIARASAWADIFVASGLDADTVESLAMAPLERPEQARRLAASGHSVTFLNRAEYTRAEVGPE